MIIQARGLRKRFRVRTRTPGRLGAVRDVIMPRRRQITAVDGIELEVDRGEVIAFIGPNGAGKSTTIKLLTGILHRDAGTVSVLGMDPQRHRRRLAYRIATVFGQKSQLWFHLPPIDTFRLLADVYDLEPRRARERIASLTEIFGIGRHLTTPVRKLSLGERIRCEIAASLIHDPELLLLDEPTIGLDVVIRQRIRDLIAEVNREREVTVFLTSHDTGDIEKVCRRAVVINHGRIVWDGAVGELRGSLLATKIMDLKLDAPLVFDQPDVTIRHAGRYTATLEVDTRSTRIEAVVRAILKRNAVLDITISDPPMEDLFEAIDAPIRGYSFTDVAFLWAVAAAGFGLGAIVCGNAGQLSRIIYQGDLDVYLTQPKPVLPNLLASRMSVSSWGDLLYGLGLFAFTQPLTVSSVGLYLLFTVLAAGVFTAVRVLYHSLTFLLGNAEDVAGVGSEQVITFSLYPGSIFDGPLVAVVLHTLIPAALVAHLPAELFRAVARGAAVDWGMLAAIVGGDAALIAAAGAAFYLGLRRYESGNRVGARI